MILQSLGLWGVLLGPAHPAAPPAAPQEAAAEQTSAEAADLLQAIFDEYDEAYSMFIDAYQAAETEEARNLAFEEHYPDAAEYIERVLPIAHSEGASDVGYMAIEWALENAGEPTTTAEVLGLLREHHIGRKDLGNVLSGMGYQWGEEISAFLQAVLDNNDEVEVQAQAWFSLGQVYSNRADMAVQIRDASEEDLGSFVEFYGEDQVAGLQKLGGLGVKDLRDKAVACFERVAEDERFAAVSSWRGTLGEQAAGFLFEAKNLAIGMVAPEIEGTDADEVAFKLSDYRGQVVLLDFWGDW